MKQKTILMRNQSRNAFLGQMIGDALGGRYEFSINHFGVDARTMVENDTDHETGFLPMLGGGIFQLDPGQITDDTEMALSLVESILRGKEIRDDIILKGYKNWYNSKPFDIGNNTKYIFGNITNTSPPESRKLAATFNAECRKLYHSDNLSNGALMRISPIAIYAASLIDKYQDKLPLLVNLLLRLAYLDTSLSHSSKDAIVASATFIALVGGNIVNGPHNFDKTTILIKTIASESTRISEIVKRALLNEKLDPPPTINIGYLGTALQLAILRSTQIVKKEISFHRALVSTIELGGDTDTNCAVVGAAIGALVPLDDIPFDWRASVLNSSNKAFMKKRMTEHKPYGHFCLEQIDQIMLYGENLT